MSDFEWWMGLPTGDERPTRVRVSRPTGLARRYFAVGQEVAVDRWIEAAGQPVVLLPDGRSFGLCRDEWEAAS